MYIYKATNLINGKIYIGQTTLTIHKRKQRHFLETFNPNKKNPYFHNAINKYGKDNFIFEQIDEATSLEELNEKESYWIAHYNSTDENVGYNLDSGGGNTKRHDKTKIKIGKMKKKNWQDEEMAKKMRDGLRIGTETVKARAVGKSYECVCERCGKVYFLTKWESKKRKYCSTKCSSPLAIKVAREQSSIVRIEERKTRWLNIKEFAENWALKNKEKVVNCPMNKISPELKELQQGISDRFNVKDWRIIGLAVSGFESKKELLNWLKSFVKTYADLDLN